MYLKGLAQHKRKCSQTAHCSDPALSENWSQTFQVHT